MSFRKFRRKLGWRSSKDDPSALSQGPVKQHQQHPATRDDGTASGKASSNDPIDSPSPSIPETPSVPDLPPQAHPKEDTTQEIAPIRKGSEGNIRELWDLAYGALRDEDEQLILDFEKKIEEDLSAGLSKTVGSPATKRDWMNTVLTRKMEQVNRDSWKLKFGSSEILVKDVVKPILGVVSWANDFISKAVSANPSASLAWGGVSLLLPLFLNPSEQAASLAQGLEYISSVIVQSYLWEDLYERYSKSEAGGPSQITYRSALTTLYHHVLEFQMTSYCYYSRSTASRLGLDSVKWHGWEDLLEKIKEQERVFSAVLNGCRDVRYDEECSAAEQRHEQVISCWQTIGTDVSGLLSAVTETQREEKRIELLQWLCAVDTSALYNAARDKHQTGTCKWLVEDSKDFKTWIESPKSLLWLNGKPGCGKSILSSSVIKHLQDNCKSDPGTALAYFYFNFGNLEQQSVAIMLSSLVKQLCASRPDTPQAIKNFENYKTKGERPDTKTLEEALIESTRGFSDVFIVVDALDECPTLNGERGKLLASLNRITAAMPDNLHLFCTSRAEPDINTAINKLLYAPSRTAIDLLKDATGLHSDISLYIDSVLESDNYHSWPEELKADAKRLMVERADGMFQYIVCQFESLQNLRSKSLISAALENLPEGLDATYDRLLLSIEPGFQAQCLSALKWLAFSNRTLRLKELAEIFILRPERAVGFDKAERLFEPEEVLRYLSSLITVQKARKRRNPTTYVRLAHFTIKEYLISSRIRKGPAACFSFTENDAHLHISHCCLVYHLYETEKNGGKGRFPLSTYATSNFGWHLETTPRQNWTSDVVRLAARALAVGSHSLWLILLFEMYVETGTTYKLSEARRDYLLRRPYCYTAILGFLNLTDLLLSAASDTYDYLTQEDLDVTLQEATFAGHIGIVQLVLDKGAHVNAQNEKGESVLQVAAARNNPQILHLLLRYGAITDKSGCPLTSALTPLSSEVSPKDHFASMLEQPASRTGLAECTRSLQLLINNGADINKQCAVHGTALSKAAEYPEHLSAQYLMAFLLQHGADVNMSGGSYGYPLQAACSHDVSYFGFELSEHKRDDRNCTLYRLDDDAVVMTLLKMGAEVNAQGGKYGNALQAASYAGNHAVVRSLLDRDADINMPGGHFGTALQAACAGAHQYIVCILLARGADVHVPGGLYGNALQAACATGHWETVGLLLDAGARADAQGGMYGNALQAACYAPEVMRQRHSWMDIIQQLLERGADVNTAGGEFGSALQAASSSRCVLGEAIASFLLGKGAEVNKQGGLYGTALQGACARGRVGVVRILLAHGSDVNIVGGKYGTALQAACANEDSYQNVPELVGLLIEHGADVHIRGGAFGSAWHAAAHIGDSNAEEILKTLLDHGVNVNDISGRQYGTALQAAFELPWSLHQSTSRVNFLLQHGADINVGAGVHGSGLQSVCMSLHDFLDNDEEFFDRLGDIDVNIVGGKYGTALQAAAHTKKYDLVGYLLDKGANVNTHGGEYGNALDAAVCAGDEDVVTYLVDNGADADARGGKYGSALNAAVVKGYWDLVEILLKAGAKPDCHGLVEPNEEWLKWAEKEDGRGAVERYRKFWELQKPKAEEARLEEEQTA